MSRSIFDKEYINDTSWCNPREKAFLLHQTQLSNFTVNNPNNLLIFHGLGSGKSCTAVIISEMLKQKIPNLDIYVATKKSVVNQFKLEFSNCPLKTSKTGKNPYKVEPSKQLVLLQEMQNKNTLQLNKQKREERAYVIEREKTLELNNIYVITHHGIVSSLKTIIERKRLAVIIIDEVQNFISDESACNININSLIYSLSLKGLLSRLYLLTATPLTNYPNEFSQIIQLLNYNTTMPIEYNEFIKTYWDNLDLFKQHIKGHISYFSGGNPNAYPLKRIIIQEHYLAPEQEQKYIESIFRVFKSDDYDEKNINNMSEIGKYCNSSRDITQYVFGEIQDFAPKLHWIIQSSIQCPGTVFIYSEYIGYGITLLSKLLTDYGYELWEPSMAIEKTPSVKKRFFVWTGDSKVSTETKELARDIFNQVSNTTGDYIKIILGSRATSEGVEFLNLHTIHVVDPWWHLALFRQIVARGVRFRSHCSSYDPEVSTIPTVNIYRHVSVFNKKRVTIPLYTRLQTSTTLKRTNNHPLMWMTNDEYRVFLSSRKNIINTPFEEAAKEAAIDCYEFQNGNIYRLEERLIPEKPGILNNRYFIYYENPLNSLKYRKESEGTIHDIHTYNLNNFEKVPKGTRFILQRTTIDKLSLEDDIDDIDNNKEVYLIVGENLTSTLIGNEKINCM
jgi:superfamily II DNA or RNA helicase